MKYFTVVNVFPAGKYPVWFLTWASFIFLLASCIMPQAVRQTPRLPEQVPVEEGAPTLPPTPVPVVTPTPVITPEPSGTPTLPMITSSPTVLSPITTSSPTPPSSTTSAPLPATAKKIEFETINAYINSRYQGRNALIQIITNKEDSNLNLLSNNEQFLGVVSDTDFSKYFVIIAFQGFRSFLAGQNIQVISIWQEKDIISVQATFTEAPTSGPAGGGAGAVISPYHAIKVSRMDLPDSRPITFKLLDQGKNERAIFVLKD